MFISSMDLILGRVEPVSRAHSSGLTEPSCLLAPLPQALAATIALFESVSLTVSVSHR